MYAVERPLPRPSPSPVEAPTPPRDQSAACAKLQNAKERVRLLIDTIGERRWKAIVSQPLPAWAPTTRRPASRSYFKLWEMARTCALPPAETCVLLCEAPGGFAQACEDVLRPRDWLACSLPGAIAFHGGLPKGRTEYVDLLDTEQRDAFVARTRLRFADGVDFVSGDGAAEMDHSRLEEQSLPILAAQVDTAVALLRPGGTFVVKAFELCTPQARDVLARLACTFEAVSLIKPTLSRPTNSEVYVVCRVFVDDVSPPPRMTQAWHDAVVKVTDHLCLTQEAALRAALRETSTY